MSAYREPTPFDQPFPGAINTLKRELSKNLEVFVFRFGHENQTRASMSRLMRLNEALLMQRAREVGGKILFHMEKLMGACGDFANGQGTLEQVNEHIERLRDSLRS